MEAKAPIAFDIVRKGIAPVVYSMQGDSNTRSIFISLFNDSIPWQVPADVSIAVAYKKPDGSKGLYDKLPNGKEAITVSGSSVKAIFAPQMLTVPGEVIASVVFFDKDINRLSTFPFIVMVTSDPSSGKQVSNDYYKFSTMEEVSKAVDAALAALEVDKQAFLDEAAKALALTPPAIVCETTGAVIQAGDSSDRPLHGLRIYGKTTQDGTPTPENPVELVSAGASGAINTTVAGKNLWDEQWQYGYYRNTGAGNHVATTQLEICTENPIPVIPNTSYVVSCVSGTSNYVTFLDKNRNFIDSSFRYTTNIPFTIPDGAAYMRLNFGSTYGGTYKNDISVVMGAEPLPYEPYKPMQTLTASTPNGLPGIPVSSGGNYTDENGQQWICDEIDFAKGVYVQRTKTLRIADIINSNFGISSLGVPWIDVYFSTTFNAANAVNALSTGYKRIPSSNNGQNGAFKVFNSGFTIYDSAFTDAEQAKQRLIDMGVVFLAVLATPIETPLSAEELAQYATLHTNKPNTTVYNDAGAGLSIDYVADTKMYIDNKLAAISAAVLNA